MCQALNCKRDILVLIPNSLLSLLILNTFQIQTVILAANNNRALQNQEIHIAHNNPAVYHLFHLVT